MSQSTVARPVVRLKSAENSSCSTCYSVQTISPRVVKIVGFFEILQDQGNESHNTLAQRAPVAPLNQNMLVQPPNWSIFVAQNDRDNPMRKYNQALQRFDEFIAMHSQ